MLNWYVLHQPVVDCGRWDDETYVGWLLLQCHRRGCMFWCAVEGAEGYFSWMFCNVCHGPPFADLRLSRASSSKQNILIEIFEHFRASWQGCTACPSRCTVPWNMCCALLCPIPMWVRESDANGSNALNFIIFIHFYILTFGIWLPFVESDTICLHTSLLHLCTIRKSRSHSLSLAQSQLCDYVPCASSCHVVLGCWPGWQV